MILGEIIVLIGVPLMFFTLFLRIKKRKDAAVMAKMILLVIGAFSITLIGFAGLAEKTNSFYSFSGICFLTAIVEIIVAALFVYPNQW